ncbi:transmembrane protein 199-like [Penaeus indicus]|uniref:transmembrane protein 199-like n=1 Tax=Penaeus indicus TaxID=29960 RepID=UPI00300D7BC5
MTKMEDHVLIIPSKRFVQILQELRDAFGSPQSIQQKIPAGEGIAGKEIKLTTQDIKWCHEKMRERGIPERVHELLAESEIILPKYEPPPRSPELEARIQRLRFEQENRDYKDMVKSVDNVYQGEGTQLGEIGKEMRIVNRHIISGLQYLLSVIGTFFAVFIALGMATQDYGVRALVATLAALAVGLAEMYFIIREDLKEEKKQDKVK